MIVLVVDDQIEIRETARVLIAKLGHTAAVAEDAASAVELALDWLPELALLDIQMPDINGYKIAKSLREEFGSAIWICAVTGSPVDMPTAAQSGFDGVLAKPLSEELLRACLEEARRTLKRSDVTPMTPNPMQAA